MANFSTHLKIGVFVSGGAVLALDGLGLVAPDHTFALFGLGVLGSLLPDIDADASSPVRAIFGLLGAALAFGWTLPMVGRYPPLELALVWGGLFVATRYLLLLAFARFTVHRGIWHSWLAAAFVTLATVNLAHWVLHQPSKPAWVAGLMVGLGYLTHLSLDEIYSVDIFNSRLRRSFGTALKPLVFRSKKQLPDGRRGGAAVLATPTAELVRSRPGRTRPPGPNRPWRGWPTGPGPASGWRAFGLNSM